MKKLADMFKPSVVSRGSTGLSVYILQAMLRGLQLVGVDNKPIEIDGIVGKNTENAIKQFQKTQVAYGFNCRIDGIFDLNCWSRLLGV